MLGKKTYDIIIKFKRGVIASQGQKITKLLKLTSTSNENMNMIDFDGERVIAANYVQVIQDFTDWRLSWYKKRYQRLTKLLGIDIQKYLDILLAIKKNVGGMAKKIQSRTEMKDVLKEMGIVHIEYIADLAVYRFTENEKAKVEKKLEDAYALMQAAALETALVAQTLGIRLPFDDPVKRVEEVARMTAPNHSSMYQDVQRGAPTEIEAISGAIVTKGEHAGVSAPVNRVLLHLIRALVSEELKGKM